MEDYLSPNERKLKRKGLVTSMIVHAIVILLLLLPLLSIPIPPPGPPGVLVNLGLPDVGQGAENAPMEEPLEEELPIEEEVPEPVQRPEPVKKPTPEKNKPVVVTEDPDAVALRQQKEKERQELERKQQEEAENRRRQEEEARKKAEAEERRKDMRERFKSRTETATGTGNGNTNKPGNQGNPDGDPTGKTTGEGGVGASSAGFGSRKPTGRPTINDNFQSQGTIVLDVCVDASGKVIKVEFSQRGSNSNSPQLINIAKANAMKWRFEPGEEDEQCGTITYRFSLK